MVLGTVGWANPPNNKQVIHLKVERENYTACGRRIQQLSDFVTNVNYNENPDTTTCPLCFKTLKYQRMTKPIKKIVVKQCKECPKCYPAIGTGKGWSCNLANRVIARNVKILDQTVIPNWCPLEDDM